MHLPKWLILLSILAGLTACEDSKKPQALSYADSAASTTSVPTYYLAIHPLHNPQKLSQDYQPLVDYLNQHIPTAHIELEASRDYQAFEEKYQQRRPEIILPNPWQAIQAMQHNYHVIAMAGDATDFKGIIITRKDSNIKQVSDLKGKSISYPSYTALAACILPQYFLFQQGLNINTDVDNQYVGSQESSIMNVYLGKSAAGATWPPPWRAFQKSHPAEASQMMVSWETPPLINNAFMIRDDLPPPFVQQLQQQLIELSHHPEGVLILKNMETNRFYPADDAEYQKVQTFMDTFEQRVRPINSKSK